MQVRIYNVIQLLTFYCQLSLSPSILLSCIIYARQRGCFRSGLCVRNAHAVCKISRCCGQILIIIVREEAYNTLLMLDRNRLGLTVTQRVGPIRILSWVLDHFPVFFTIDTDMV